MQTPGARAITVIAQLRVIGATNHREKVHDDLRWEVGANPGCRDHLTSCVVKRDEPYRREVSTNFLDHPGEPGRQWEAHATLGNKRGEGGDLVENVLSQAGRNHIHDSVVDLGILMAFRPGKRAALLRRQASFKLSKISHEVAIGEVHASARGEPVTGLHHRRDIGVNVRDTRRDPRASSRVQGLLLGTQAAYVTAETAEKLCDGAAIGLTPAPGLPREPEHSAELVLNVLVRRFGHWWRSFHLLLIIQEAGRGSTRLFASSGYPHGTVTTGCAGVADGVIFWYILAQLCTPKLSKLLTFLCLI